eukprot:TRINITY_DN2967_c1_g1_i4.p1 TRINITY_DN2967_c1_g1~~TRINITY_DN2967_c1_g1_i4.p1  ORF type:complete len:117 (-),score=5.17 TRINITY_DN2967_c1_g1_i4:148-453(-)
MQGYVADLERNLVYLPDCISQIIEKGHENEFYFEELEKKMLRQSSFINNCRSMPNFSIDNCSTSASESEQFQQSLKHGDSQQQNTSGQLLRKNSSLSFGFV